MLMHQPRPCYFLAALILFAQAARLGAEEIPVAKRAADQRLRRELTQVLDQLAVSAERITMGGRMGNAGDALPDVLNLGRAARFLATLPAVERYELLKNWVLPPEPGAMMRTAMCFAPAEFPPEVFFSDVPLPETADAEDAVRGITPGNDGVLCFVEMLVIAAEECGKLPELTEAVARFDNHANMADTLIALTSFARKRDSDNSHRVDEFLAAWQQEVPVTGQVRRTTWSAYAVARSWVRSEVYREQGERLADLVATFARNTEQKELLSHLLRDQAVWRVQRSGGTLMAGAEPGLALWHPGGYYYSGGSQAGTWPSWWVERDGVILHVAGPEVSPLYFDYPLAGTFEFQVDGFCDASAGAAIQYGRILFEPFWRDGKAQLAAIGERESVQRPAAAEGQGRFHRLVIRVSPEKVSYLCDGVLVLEDESPSPATPWLALLGRGTRTTAWCHLRLAGDPQVLREVHLLEGDRMEGWMSPLYRESLPRQLRSVDPTAGAVTAFSPPSAPGAAWFAAEGVLHGPRLKVANRSFAIQSWLAYHRPLRVGETLSYEFFYQPEEKLVHPALGRMAMLLEPTGVRLHWITDVPHMDIGGLGADNAVAIPQERRGPDTLPLEPGAWNTIAINMAVDRATLLLNGTEIYEHRLAPTESRMFGLFRHRNRTAAEVRSIVLQGDWPKGLSVDQLSQPAARGNVQETAAGQNGRKALVGESWFEPRVQPR